MSIWFLDCNKYKSCNSTFFVHAYHVTGDELISPCMCKGTQQFVHRSCLDHWRSVKVLSNVSATSSFHFVKKSDSNNTHKSMNF